MKTPGLWKGTAAQGYMPPMGVKLEIESIERTETGEGAQTPGARAYRASYRILEPPEYRGRRLTEWFNIGTKEDPKAKRDETWNRQEGGPGKLLRLMEKAGITPTDEDEEWMEAAEGATVYAHIGVENDRRDGQKRNNVNGRYFAEKDDDFVGVGESLEAPAGGRGRKPARGGHQEEPRSARGESRTKRREDDEDEEKREDEGNGDEEVRKTASARKGGDRRDEDEDDAPKRAARSGGNRRDRDEDED